jgi:phosphoribosyl 1,2-cyclic phosphodiesterase
VKLTFLGTRGYIEGRTERHFRHTSLEVSYRSRRVMIDCGEDWAGELDRVRPQALVLTHGHPDHVGGLAAGAPCPVWATEETWRLLALAPLPERHLVVPRRPFTAAGIAFEAFPVEHSTRAPAVGYRVAAGRRAIFYAPDLVYIHERADALAGIDLYVGDGATVSRSFVRRQGERLIGHAPVSTQLGWCRKEGVARAIITHCGSEIVAGDEAALERRIRALGQARGVAAELAWDGLEVVLR